MMHGSLFSGIGGFDLAAEWMGWENSFHCEINEFGQKVLKHYWPNATSYTDITKTDFTIWRDRIDTYEYGITTDMPGCYHCGKPAFAHILEDEIILA